MLVELATGGNILASPPLHCRAVVDSLLTALPSMFASTAVADSAMGPALQVGCASGSKQGCAAYKKKTLTLSVSQSEYQ